MVENTVGVTESVESLLQPQNFGCGDSIVDHPFIEELPDEELFTILAHFAACPVRDKVFAYYKSLGPEAVKWIIQRYETTNRITKHLIWAESAKLNPALYTELTSSQSRNPGEPVGKFEPGSVPPNHSQIISPMAKHFNYSGARLINLMARTNQLEEIARNPEVMTRVRNSISSAKSGEELAARFAQDAWDMGVNAVSILEHVTEYDKWKEEGYTGMMQKTFSQLRNIAPALIKVHKVLESYVPPPKARDPVKFYLEGRTSLPSSLSIAHTPFRFTEIPLVRTA